MVTWFRVVTCCTSLDDAPVTVFVPYIDLSQFLPLLSLALTLFNLFIGDVNIKPEIMIWFLQRWNNNAGGTNPLFATPHNPTGDRPQQQRLAFYLFPGDCTGSLLRPSGWPLSSSHLAPPAFNRTMFCQFVCLSSQSAPPILVCNLSTRPSQPPQEHYAPSGVFIPPRGLLGAAMCSSLSPSSPRDSLCNGIVISCGSLMSWWD